MSDSVNVEPACLLFNGNSVGDDLRIQKRREPSLCLLILKVLGKPVLKTGRVDAHAVGIQYTPKVCIEGNTYLLSTLTGQYNTTPQTSSLQSL